jgi:hypothetical protein
MMILHKKLLGEVPMTYNSGAVATAVYVGAAVAAAATVYSSQEQKSAQKKATASREAAERANQARLDKINADRRPDQESANVEFGQADTGNAGDTYEDFLVPTANTSKLGSSGGSGITSSGVASLGMK